MSPKSRPRVGNVSAFENLIFINLQEDKLVKTYLTPKMQLSLLEPQDILTTSTHVEDLSQAYGEDQNWGFIGNIG